MALNVLMISAYPLQQGKVVGGIESVVSTLAPALAEQDGIRRVTICCTHLAQKTVERVEINDKLHIVYAPAQKRLGVMTRSIQDVMTAKRVAAYVQPDIVHGQEIGWRGDVATQVSPNSVITVHGLLHKETALSAKVKLKEKVRLGFVEGMVQRVLSRAKVTISISKYDSAEIAGMVKGHHVYIPNPIAPLFFEQPMVAVPSQPKLVFAGVQTPRKNIEGLLHAFALTLKHVPNAKLAIVGPSGSPEYTQKIKDLATSLMLNDHVDFVGMVENDRLVAEIQSSRALVMFSHEETLPTILAQAMTMGKPVVGPRVGGIPEMIQDGVNGFIVERDDRQALAERLAILLRSPDLCRQMGEAGYDFARQNYEPKAVAKKTVDAYNLVHVMPAKRHF